MDDRFVYDEALQKHIPRQEAIHLPKPVDWWMDTDRRVKRITRLRNKGLSPEEIAKKTGYNIGYIRRVIFGYNK